MDYLDPNKQRRHRNILLVGYLFVAVAIVFATWIMLYLSYGYAVNRNGVVIQNGLVFLSSQPNPATITLNGKLNKAKTNSRLVLPSGIYRVVLSRAGYRDWQRTIEVDGSSVTHFDYPFLVPKQLATTNRQAYSAAPGLSTQSPDRHWLLVQQPGSALNYDVFDLKSPTKAPTVITLPTTIASSATASSSWQPVQWADDNVHVVLRHDFDGKSEYILVDRTNPDQSLNLNSTLGVSPAKLTLNNLKFDQYYIYSGGVLQSVSLKATTPQPVLDHVLAYQTYGTTDVLYVTDSDAPAGKVLLKLKAGDQTYVLHTFPASPTYVVDLTKFDGTLYVVAGAGNENKVYIYRDPIGQLNAQPNHAVVPSQVLHVQAPNYVGFSMTAQYVVAENGAQFGTYDIFNKTGYNYTLPDKLDGPQAHAAWMDGTRLTYVSGGKLLMFDYDGTNRQLLMPAAPAFLPAFTPDYKYVEQLAPATAAGQFNLTQTALRVPADL